MKKLLFGSLIIIGAFVLWFFLSSKNPQPNSQDNADLVLYWGNGCSHCENVKKYIQNQSLDSKLNIAQKEVYYNRSNQQEMMARAKSCPDIDTTQGVGVPFAYVPETKACIIGDSPIIDWLNQKSGINN